jgi:hypothetical protein
MRRFKRFQFDLSQLHFCKADKVKYRKHLTVGMVVATAAGMVGTAYDVVLLLHVAAAANCVTAIWWIWE